MQQMTEEGSVLQCQGELTKKMSFKPSNVLSKAHRTLTLAVRKRAVKGSRIKKYAETIDPEQVRSALSCVRVPDVLSIVATLDPNSSAAIIFQAVFGGARVSRPKTGAQQYDITRVGRGRLRKQEHM